MVETRYVELPPLPGRIDLTRPHLIGIAGQGMSALAHLLTQRGVQVSGSDLRRTPSAAALEAAGGTVHTGHDPQHITGATAVVWSSAVAEANPELEQARTAGIPLVHRSDVLSQLLADAEQSVVVAGTHGKSTTTAMLASAVGCLSPSWAGGGALVGGLNAANGTGGLFIAEGDESDRSLVRYQPSIGIVLNVDDDHPESLTGIDDTMEVYLGFARHAGTLLLSADDPGGRRLAVQARAIEGLRLVTVGEASDADVRITGIRRSGDGWSVTVRETGGAVSEFSVPVPGRHNAVNAAVAFAAGRLLGVEAADLAEGLAAFPGVQRRLTAVGQVSGVSVWDSFAHHPAAITVDIAAARTLAGDGGRVLVVFEPSGAARTAVFGTAMGQALAAADDVVLLGVHRAVATDVQAGTGEIAAGVTSRVGQVHLADGIEEAASLAAGLAGPGDVVLAMGTGTVAEAGGKLLAHLAAAPVAAA
jgi:UDP-N-acetylmuramate--alanine ligase